MPYGTFSITQIKQTFDIRLVEGGRFLPEVPPIAPSPQLQSELEDLPWAIAVGFEKARSEAIIYPVLQEVRRLLNQQIGLLVWPAKEG